MRSRFISLVAATFALACADVPTAPVVQPPDGIFSFEGDPPPPWAGITGEILTDGGGLSLSLSGAGGFGLSFSHSAGGNTAVYVGWLLVTPGGHAAILRFTEGANVTFSSGARIMKVNGKVSGVGRMTVGGHSYDLSAVTVFEANPECATVPFGGPSCASFSADDGSFRSDAALWTGVLSNDGGGGSDGLPPGWDDGKPGNGPPVECGMECVITTGATTGKSR